MPSWVQQGVDEYSKRIAKEFNYQLIETSLAHRSKSKPVAKCIEEEGEALLSKLGKDDFVAALEVRGTSIDTNGLARRIEDLQQSGRNLVMLVGGPDGLSQSCRDRADVQWSLSAMTLPHPFVRILLTEQIYRASSILKGHPYHRD